MPSTKKSAKSGSKQSRVQVRDLKPEKDAKGGSLKIQSLPNQDAQEKTTPI